MTGTTEVIAWEDAKPPTLENNIKVWISEGDSRYCLRWKNRELLWSSLLVRLRGVTRTQETQAEYLRMDKAAQDKIKDVGGFVGGTLKGGRRKGDRVDKRYLITLDLDFAPQDFTAMLQLEAPYAWAVYSTHKHKPDAPRLRLIIPLDRPVDPDEYEAITRRLADDIGMPYFDSTTFQPSRMMFWPSCSRDAEFVYQYSDGPMMRADDYLGMYPDWRDVSFWPVHPDEQRVGKKRDKKQADPTAKAGPVGLFCRTYTVPEAIETFLSDIYAPTEGQDDRYTYLAGSTSGGLVVYDDGLFCYSHHGTDPAHGMDLNAFDIVRIHKFGAEDEDTPDDVAASRRPSYQAMQELIRQDKGCILEYDRERKESARKDFDGEEAEDGVPEGEEWKLALVRKKNGEVEKSMTNLEIILRRDPELSGIRYNSFSGFIDISSSLPWGKAGGEWDNSDDSRLFVYLSRCYTTFSRPDIADGLVQVSRERAYHPVREYLESLPEWDGVERAARIFVDYLGAEDTEYCREVARRWLLAALSRVYTPGCKFDYMPVLSGRPGIGKSTLIAKLGKAWFSDSLSFEDMKDKTAAEKIQGTWINEISELKGMRKVEVEGIKSFLSRQSDRYRPSYGRRVEDKRRTCVFVGTSNDDDYLKDITGNRRFWPVLCDGGGKRQAWDLTDKNIGQIWAEAMQWYAAGDRRLTLPKGLEGAAEKAQIKALEHDEREGLVGRYLDVKLPENWDKMDTDERRYWIDDELRRKPEERLGTVERQQVTVLEIWAECFGKRPADRKRSDSDDIARILLRLGWGKRGTKKSGLYGTQAAFRKPT